MWQVVVQHQQLRAYQERRSVRALMRYDSRRDFGLAMALNPVFPYHNLRHLSRVFKDNLANRLLCKLLEGNVLCHSDRRRLFFCSESGQRSSATLIALPNEIKVSVSMLMLLSLYCCRIASFGWQNIFRSNRYCFFNRPVERCTTHSLIIFSGTIYANVILIKQVRPFFLDTDVSSIDWLKAWKWWRKPSIRMLKKRIGNKSIARCMLKNTRHSDINRS